jgi:hypothetical protein
VIEILAFVVQGVEQTFELMAELLRLNSEVPLGAFSMCGQDIFYSHSFPSGAACVPNNSSHR